MGVVRSFLDLSSLRVTRTLGAWTAFLLASGFGHCVQAKELGVQALFFPGTGCTENVVKALQSARWFINFEAYNVIPDSVVKALIDARSRGVKVEVILDKGLKSSDRNSSADSLVRAGIKTYFDTKHSVARNSVVIIDETQVLTGSFDFSKSSDDATPDNLLIITDPAISGKYLENWRSHASHSNQYGKRSK